MNDIQPVPPPPRLLIPVPRAVAWQNGFCVLSGSIELRIGDEVGDEVIAWMVSLLRRYTLDRMPVRVVPHAGGGLGWRLAMPGAADGPSPSLGDGDTYAIAATPAGVSGRGADLVGLRHAWVTLLQLLQLRLEPGMAVAIPACVLTDRPGRLQRMLHLCVFPELPKEQLRRLVQLAGLLKYSHVILEFWGTLRLETIPELSWAGEACWSKDEAGELMALARSFGVEPVPMFNALGHGTASRIRFGRHVVLDQNPMLAGLFEPDGWTWCVSNPAVQTAMRSIIDELIEVAGPGGWFHLGFDEAHSFATCDRCRTGDRLGLFVEHLNGLAGHLRGRARRGIIWGDALLDPASWPKLCALSHPWLATHRAVGRLDRSLAIADWQYAVSEGEVDSIRHFRNLGFDVFAAPWWNAKNIRTLAASAQRAGALGLMQTTWHRLPQHMDMLPRAALEAWPEQPLASGSYELDYAAQLSFLAAHGRLLSPSGGAYRSSGWLPTEVPVQEE